MNLHDLKTQHATDNGFTDWQDLRESVQDDTEYENHWHAVCVKAQKESLRNAAENSRIEHHNTRTGVKESASGMGSHGQIYNVDRASITNEQNLIR